MLPLLCHRESILCWACVGPSSALQWSVPLPRVPSARHTSPVPTHPPLAFLDKSLSIAVVFNCCFHLRSADKGLEFGNPSAFSAWSLPGHETGEAHPPQPKGGTQPIDGPFLSGTELPLTRCIPRSIVCNKVHWKWMGASRVPTLTCPGQAEPQPTPPQLWWGKSTGMGQTAKRWGGKWRCTSTWGAGWPAPLEQG